MRRSAGGVTALWTSSALAAAMQGKASSDFSVCGVAFDSREIGAGDLFLALKGEQSNGHLYVDQAFAAGAAGAIVSESVDGPHILVSDTTAALNLLAKASRDRTASKIIGVTGSVGKTGTKDALFAALDRCSLGHAHRSVKSYNNHVGVPLSLSRMPETADYGIFEMGMNHTGELAELTQLVRPDVAVITTIGPAHIGNFANGEEGIADAKAEIFEGLTADGTAIIPFDRPHYQRLKVAAERYSKNVVSFGFGAQADVRAIDVVPASQGGSLVTAKIRQKSLCYTIAEPGKHWVSNSLAVLAAVDAAGGDLACAGLALAELGGIEGRGKRHRVSLEDGGIFELIDESYNANPVSMQATLQQMALTAPAGKKIAILGAMGELGDSSRAFHEALAEDILRSKLSSVILVGDDMGHTVTKLQQALDQDLEISHVNNASDALTGVAKKISDGDILLVKGSNYLGLGSVVSSLVSGEY